VHSTRPIGDSETLSKIHQQFICPENSAINWGTETTKFPEGTQENSPGWSEAEPWDREHREPKSQRDVRTSRTFVVFGRRNAPRRTVVRRHQAFACPELEARSIFFAISKLPDCKLGRKQAGHAASLKQRVSPSESSPIQRFMILLPLTPHNPPLTGS
jgi:hypothetical protein